MVKPHFTKESPSIKLLSHLKAKSGKLTCQSKQLAGEAAGMRAGGAGGSGAWPPQEAPELR